jgi:hypothetical protein
MNIANSLLLGSICCAAALPPWSAHATERYFTYTYEPESMPQGVLEYEQWITLRAGRNATVGQEQFNLWEFRHELEYGVTDNYTLSLYLNESLTRYRVPEIGSQVSHFQFDGVSLENRLMVLNPLEHVVGLALYLEPRIAAHEAELEQKLILGQRMGDWKWALNLTHATEWANDFHTYEGEVEVSFGLTRHLNQNWSLGLELRDNNELPEYRIWENTAFYLGPVISYRREKWWASLSVLPQLGGVNFAENIDNDHRFELQGHERLNLRLIAGFAF